MDFTHTPVCTKTRHWTFLKQFCLWYQGPILWNMLSNDLKCSNDILSFKGLWSILWLVHVWFYVCFNLAPGRISDFIFVLIWHQVWTEQFIWFLHWKCLQYLKCRSTGENLLLLALLPSIVSLNLLRTKNVFFFTSTNKKLICELYAAVDIQQPGRRYSGQCGKRLCCSWSLLQATDAFFHIMSPTPTRVSFYVRPLCSVAWNFP